MSTGDELHYLEHGGARRRYVLHAPAGADPAAVRPAVVMLDGRGGTPWTAIKSTGWSRCADAHGFFAVYPEAIRLDPAGPQHFLDNPQMWRMARAPVDDVGFLAAVLDDLVARAPVDPRRIHFSGFSNGAAMCFRFAAEFPQRVAAIAPVGGFCTVPEAPLPRPVPAIFFHGGRDPINPLDGGRVTLPWGETADRPAVRESVRQWARMCGAAGELTHRAEEPGLRVERYGDDVELQVVEELGHVWPGGHRLIPERLVGAACDRVVATDRIWDFFRARSL